MTRTRFEPLALDRIGRDWSFYDITDPDRPARVGAIYKTREEAFADLPRYARDNWGHQ
jgi:hypothetical protein